MITRYVLKGFRRHKMRTAIMIVALMFVSTMLVVLNNTIATSKRQTANMASKSAGAHDIVITHVDTNPQPFIDLETVPGLLKQAAPQVKAIHPRFQVKAAIERGARGGSITLLARDPEVDTVGTIKMINGEYELQGDNIVVLRDTADTYNLNVGDEIYLNYIVPTAREVGKEKAEKASVRQLTHKFTVVGIARQTGLGSLDNGILVSLKSIQDWLDAPGRAERLIVILDEDVYDKMSAEASAVNVRRIAEQIRAALGDEAKQFKFSLPKAETLTGTGSAFSVLKTMTTLYGVLSMGVVSLLVYSLINANVDDRRRDLAFLRVIGAQRKNLFSLVLIEVFLIGAIGVGLGVVAGQTLSTLVVDRVIGSLLTSFSGGGMAGNVPVMDKINFVVSPWSLISTAMIAGGVLLLSALAPAFKAATTKIRYAIDPGSADSLQIEDLARLRERRFNWKITIAGLVLTIMWGLIFVGQEFVFSTENESAVVVFYAGGLILMVLGVSLLFFTLTIVFERVVLALFGLIAPRLAFFSDKNVRRAKRRNTMIALMIVFSATLPTFLGTTAALAAANDSVSSRQSNGAPITGRASGGQEYFFYYFGAQEEDQEFLRPKVLAEVGAVSGIERVVGLTSAHNARVRNLVKLHESELQIYAWTSSPLRVLYPDLTAMAGDGAAAFTKMFHQPDAIIVPEGVAEYFGVKVGDVLVVDGKGKDHQVEMTVVGLVKRMAGFWGIDNKQSIKWGVGTAFVSLDTYLRLSNDPNKKQICPGKVCTKSERDAPVIERVFAATDPAVPEMIVADNLRTAFSDRDDLMLRITAEEVQESKEIFKKMRLVLLVLTVLSLATSVMGVFSVIYITVQTRRIEIGLLKAVGITGRQLVGILAIESLAMTVSATLSGATAGTGLGYLFYLSQNIMMQSKTPMQPAFDGLTVSSVLVMVIVSSLISAVFASRSIVKQRVTEILRGV